MHHAPGLFTFFRGPAMESLGTGAQREQGSFYLFTLLPFYLLKAAAACYTECGSDSCEEGDCNLQNCFPGTYFHNL